MAGRIFTRVYAQIFLISALVLTPFQITYSQTYSKSKSASARLNATALNAQRFAVGNERQGMYLGASSAKTLGCVRDVFDPVRGLTLGCTFSDRQKEGSMGRQIATDASRQSISFIWWDQSPTAPMGHSVYCDRFWLSTLGLGGLDCFTAGIIPPYFFNEMTLDAIGDGRVVLASEQNRGQGLPGSRFQPFAIINQTLGLGDFIGGDIDTIVWSPFLLGNATRFGFPKVAYTNDTVDITHIVISSDRTDDDNLGLYTRRVDNSWQPAVTLGLSGYGKSFVITSSRQSQRVGIAWSGGRGDGTEAGVSVSHYNGLISGKNDNDIYIMTSEDAGATWSPIRNVTRRPNADAGGFAPHAKLSILFDEADVLHVAWQAIAWPGYEGEFTTRSRLFHWDEANNAVRIAFDAVWDPILCNGGENTLNIDNPQLSACDGKLYLTFVQYAPVPYGRGDDCATRAFSGNETGSANGDIYVTVSSNGGFNWDPSRNLTNTYTPNCDTVPGGANPDCDSDVWHSATRYGIDITGGDFDALTDLTANIDPAYAGSDYLFVQYINDGDAGAAVRGEGAWTDNAVKAIRFGCVGAVAPSVCVSSSLPRGLAITDPAHVLPGQDTTIIWLLENVGNSDATYSFEIVTLSGPEGHTTVDGQSSGGGTISSGLFNSVELTLRLNSTLSTVVQNAASMIILDGIPGFCGILGENLPDTFFINYCICDLQALKIDSLDNFMVLANNGNIGFSNNIGGIGRLNFDFVGDPSECDTSATSYLFDASPVISYNNGHVVSAMYSLSIVDSFQFRPQGEPQAETELIYEHASSGLFTTQDSALGLSVDYWTPPGNLPVGGTWKPVIVRVGYYNLTNAPIDSVFCAYALDWDVPSDFKVRNTSAIEAGAAPTYIYQQGSETGADPDNSPCRNDATRYAATIYTPPQEMNLVPYSDGGSGAMGVGFQALFTRDNATFVGGNWDHPAVDSMLHTNFGMNIFSSADPDSQFVDLHTMFNGGAYRIDPDDTLYLWLRLLTGFGTQAEFEAAAEATRALVHPEGCCRVPGDANGSGRYNIADITYLISRIFAGGPAPQCCEEADCNGDGKVNIADITRQICIIFAGCPPCVCGPVGMKC